MAAPAHAFPSTAVLDQAEAAKWRWSNKALDRLAEHAFTEREAMAAILVPASVEPGDAPQTQLRKRGAVVAVVNPVTKVVVTIMDAYAGQRAPRRVFHRVPAPAPVAPVRPAAPPPPRPEVPVDPRSVKNMAARIRLLNAEHSVTVPSIVSDWLPGVCLPRLKDYPGRWALVLTASHPGAAKAWAEQVAESHKQVETAVRGVNVYGRYVQ